MISRNPQSLRTATDLSLSFLRRDIDEFFSYPFPELQSECWFPNPRFTRKQDDASLDDTTSQNGIELSGCRDQSFLTCSIALLMQRPEFLHISVFGSFCRCFAFLEFFQGIPSLTVFALTFPDQRFISTVRAEVHRFWDYEILSPHNFSNSTPHNSPLIRGDGAAKSI